MMTLILQHAGQDPSFVIGGEISEVGSNAPPRHRRSYFVAEADESDRSFLHLPAVRRRSSPTSRPTTSTPTATWPGWRPAFLEFAQLTDPDGFVVTCADDPGTRRAGRRRCAPQGRTVFTYGEADDADLRLTDDRLLGAAACATRPTLRRRAARRDPAAGARPAHGAEQRRRRADRAASWGCRCRRSVEALAVVPGGAAPVRAQGRRRRRPGLRRVRVPPDLGEGGAADPARGGRRRPAGGGLPAVPGLPHPRPAGRARRRRWPSPTRWS